MCISQSNSSSPLVTVIVPVYNVSAYLRQCVESIIQQTYRNLEIILVNDGSTDDSGAICDEYAALDQRIVVIHQKNRGLSGARNSGMDVMKGEYVCFVDSDDWIALDTVEVVLQKFIEHPRVDLVVFDMALGVGDDPSAYQPKNTIPWEAEYSGADVWRAHHSGIIGDEAWQKMYKRTSIEHLRFIEASPIVEDFTFMFMLFLSGGISAYVIPQSKYYYRQQRAGSLSSKAPHMFQGTYNGLKAIVESSAFVSLPRRMKRMASLRCMQIYADYIRTANKHEPNVAAKLYAILADYRVLLHHFPITFSMDGLTLFLARNLSIRGYEIAEVWIFRLIRRLHLKSYFYPLGRYSLRNAPPKVN